MLMVMIGIRKSLDCIFTKRELKILDDVMPEMIRKNHSEDEEVGCCTKISKLLLGAKLSRDKQYTKCNQIPKEF